MGYWSDWSHRRQQEAKATGGAIIQSGGQLFEGIKGVGEAFSDRAPTPKQIGGPITDLGLGVVSTGLGLGEKIFEGGRQISGDVQDISGKTQEAIGNFGTALTSAPADIVSGVTTGITAPVGQLSKDVLPLAAIAAAALLLRK